MDQIFGVLKSESGAEFCNVPQVKKGGFAKMADVTFESQLWIHSDTKIGDRW